MMLHVRLLCVHVYSGLVLCVSCRRFFFGYDFLRILIAVINIAEAVDNLSCRRLLVVVEVVK